MHAFLPIFLLVSVLGLSQALFLSLFFAVNQHSRNAATRLLVAILVVLSSVFMTNILAAQGQLSWLPLFLLTFAQYCLAPLIYLFVRVSCRKATPLAKRDGLHLLAIIPLCLPWPGLLPFLFWNLHALAYQIQVFRLIRPMRTGQPDRAGRAWAMSVALGYALTWMAINVMALISPLLEDPRALFWKVFTVLTAVHIYIIAFLALKFPLVKQRIGERLRLRRRDPSRDECLLAELERGLTQLDWFRDPDLSVATLAEKLALPAHELSRLINEGLGQNFNQLINHYRISAIKQALTSPDQDRYTIEALASEAGFRSTTSFYRIFKQTTGLTPSQFRKMGADSGQALPAAGPVLDQDPQTS